ncbi:hypothetical protein DPMN_103869 [Dreissena polymorpha]|uniref:Uncharacterized protein n=1 Tax=Dreissena polymorpha TaxID=45954 RepID=A0A9D4HBY4_DREPO|nr:hypothetical protein DPMN_103869 [Dreissena polymorpha]
MDLEKAISAGNTQNSFLHKTLVIQKSKTSEKPNDPMNALQDILETLTSKSNGISSCSRSRRNKAEKHAYKADCTLECCMPVHDPVCEECDSRSGSSASRSTCNHQLPVATCMEKPDNYVPFSKAESIVQNNVEAKVPVKSSDYVVRSSYANDSKVSIGSTDLSAIREIMQVEAIPESVVRKYKLTPAEVKEIPTFTNYTPGEPNNVGFAKC